MHTRMPRQFNKKDKQPVTVWNTVYHRHCTSVVILKPQTIIFMWARACIACDIIILQTSVQSEVACRTAWGGNRDFTRNTINKHSEGLSLPPPLSYLSPSPSLTFLPSVPQLTFCVNSSGDGERKGVSQRLGTLIPYTQSYNHRSHPGLRSRLSPNKATSLRLPPAAFHWRLSSLGSPSRAWHAWSGRACRAKLQ